MNILIRATILFLFVVSTCLGRDIYVSRKYGDDRNKGYSGRDTGSMEGPVQTIGRALELAQSGDRIIVDPKCGPYRESITLFGQNKGGTAEHPFIIEGCGAVLDGTETLPKNVWKHYQDDIFCFQMTIPAINWTFFQLFNNEELIERIIVTPDVKRIPELKPNSWCLLDGFVYFRCKDKNVSVFDSNNQFSYTGRMSGISLIQVLNVRIHDLTLQGFQLDGISAVNGAQNIVLDNVVCQKNGRSGLAVGGVSSVAAGYCNFKNNRTTQLLALPYSKTILYGCLISEDGISKTDQNAEVIVQESENESP